MKAKHSPDTDRSKSYRESTADPSMTEVFWLFAFDHFLNDFLTAGDRSKDRDFIAVMNTLVARGELLVDREMKSVGSELRIIRHHFVENRLSFGVLGNF